MIITEFVKIKTHTKLKKYYESLGYDMSNETVNIKVSDLTKSSHIIIKVKCDVCDNIVDINFYKYNNNFNKCNFYSCSSSCANKKREITCEQKYNVKNIFQSEDIKNKIKQTNLEKYGVEIPSKNENIKNKMKQTNLEKYGVETPLLNEDVKEKTLKTNLEKYNSTHYMSSDIGFKKYKELMLEKYNYETQFNSESILDKCKQTNLEKYGEDNYFKTDLFKIERDNKLLEQYNFLDIKNVKNGIYTIYCNECNNDFDIDNNLLNQRLNAKNRICLNCNKIGQSKISEQELLLINFIKDNYNGDILLQDREILNGLEIDIYIPELKLAFEYNGLYWHSVQFKDKNYHLKKTEDCRKKGIKLIHIWEDDWIYKNEIVKSRILNLLNKNVNKIYARKCIKKILTDNDNKIVRDFLLKNHIQGFVGSKIKIGLFFENELVSVMTFGNRRVAMGVKNNNLDEYELLRFCNKLNTTVIGGASKLFKYFIDIYNPNIVTTYADRSWSNGNLYETLGFTFLYKTKPNYYYVIDKIRKHRFNFRKNVLIEEGFDKDKTEIQIMNERGYYQIFDSGNFKYEYKNKNGSN